MENTITDLNIKREGGDEDKCSPTVIAAKIYSIEEKSDEKDFLYTSIPLLYEPKEEILSENEDTNEPEYGVNEGDIYEHMSIEKEEPNSSDSEFMDIEIDENSTSSRRDSNSRDSKCVVQKEAERVQEDVAQTHKIMLCPFCGTEFLNCLPWREHLNDMHAFNKRETLNMEYVEGESKAKCKQCKVKIKSNLVYLQNHKIIHLPFKRFVKCKLCGKLFTSSRPLVRHLRLVHKAIPQEEAKVPTTYAIFICPFCGSGYQQFSEWRQHLNSIHEFNKMENLNMENVSDNKSRCKECQMEVSTKMQNLQNHKITHLPYKQYVKCKLCDKRFTRVTNQIRHFEQFHNVVESEEIKDLSNSITCQPNATLICPICGVEFLEYVEWRQHVNSIHEFNKCEKFNMYFFDDNKAMCKECDMIMSCKRTWTLQHHKITHLPYNQFIKCRLCALKFEHVAAFTRHFKESHKNCPLLVKVCIASASGNTTMNQILLCPICGTEFSNCFKWRQHLNYMHEFNKRETLNMEFVGDSTAKCKECDLEVDSKLNNMQNHRITHLPFKLYVKCKLCEKSFASSRHYKQHIVKN